MKDLFHLNPEITFLNFGSFGACPKPIFENYQKWQLILENQPVDFMVNSGPVALKKSREALGNFLGCAADDLVYVTNPSYAGNMVVKSIKLEEGEEVLTTNHEYGAMDRTWNYYCRKVGAKYIQQNIALPLNSKEQFIEEFWKGYSPKTKFVFLSHITSATALIFPVKEICERAKELGLMTIIDGAHAPNHIPLNITELNPDIYFGACHKWMMAPKGSSFLYVKKELQNLIDPLIVSWGYESDFPSHSQFLDYHEMQGTRDFSAFLTTPTLIDFYEKYDWENVKSSCRKNLKMAYHKICEALKVNPITKLDDTFLGQMASIPIQTTNPLELKKVLINEYKIEVPIVQTKLQFENISNQTFLRISYQAFNTQHEIDYLIQSLQKIASEKKLLHL